MKAEDFDKKFDDNQSIINDLVLSKARRPEQEQKRVDVDFPIWMIQSLDNEVRCLGVTRQSIIKLWLAVKLEKVAV